jgi:hypothetical protein
MSVVVLWVVTQCSFMLLKSFSPTHYGSCMNLYLIQMIHVMTHVMSRHVFHCIIMKLLNICTN